MFIPSAFSPNGDGVNDLFTIGHRLVTEFEITIFDRWGRMLYQSKDLNFAWDGADPAGGVLPEGVYTYKVDWTGYHGGTSTETGTITLIR